MRSMPITVATLIDRTTTDQLRCVGFRLILASITMINRSSIAIRKPIPVFVRHGKGLSNDVQVSVRWDLNEYVVSTIFGDYFFDLNNKIRTNCATRAPLTVTGKRYCRYF